jgi:uncharacterized protein YegJ (DUF2314 family)
MTTGAERLTELVELMVMFTAVDSPNAHRAREAFGLVNDLAADNARLRGLLAALPEPTTNVEDGWSQCVMCYEGDWGLVAHSPTCPWLAVQTALQEER